MSIRMLLRAWLVCALVLLAGAPAWATPGKVVVGTYINKMTELSFKESKFSLDFYIWFRWKAEGELAEYKPLESMELINGRIDGKSSVVEKKIGELNYASARITATIFKNWALESFPFDSHRVQVHLEDSQFVDSALVFEPDVANSRLGDELSLPGWLVSGFATQATQKEYKSNYGDTSLPTDALSTYSRLTFGMDLTRAGVGSAVKLLSTVVFATLVAFVAFGIRPVDVDPRFGLGVGALFAVAASAFVVASSIPESALLTVADQMHMVAMGFIFASIVQSAICLKWDEAGEEAKWKRLDRLCIFLFPGAFLLWTGWLVFKAYR
ncbi:MAG: hypothetical protein KIT35_23560 [Piscinibacter sp.]|uniref:DUF998 domain-containing protein n=1 Tax=Piscinibacter TaxID=1114981 RepID=UPI000FDD5932|nr:MULTISPECIES: DUF998 domain-containing protein [Piscinibacter]MCW5666822.1 hypothetical protein [Piscinibacter sp.]